MLRVAAGKKTCQNCCLVARLITVPCDLGCWCFQQPPRGTQCTAAKLQTSAAHQSSAAKRTLRSMGPRLDSRIHRRRHVMASVNIAARNEFCFGAAAQPPPLRGPPPPPRRMNFASRARRRGNDGIHAYTWHGARVTTARGENISSLSAPTAPGAREGPKGGPQRATISGWP